MDENVETMGYSIGALLALEICARKKHFLSILSLKSNTRYREIFDRYPNEEKAPYVSNIINADTHVNGFITAKFTNNLQLKPPAKKF